MDNKRFLPCPICLSKEIHIVHCEEGCCGALPRAIECGGCGLWLWIDANTDEEAIAIWNNQKIAKENQVLREQNFEMNKTLVKKYKLKEPRYGKKKEISVGELAVEYGIPVGYLGCPHCGTRMSGAFHTQKCVVCNEDLFRRKTK